VRGYGRMRRPGWRIDEDEPESGRQSILIIRLLSGLPRLVELREIAGPPSYRDSKPW